MCLCVCLCVRRKTARAISTNMVDIQCMAVTCIDPSRFLIHFLKIVLLQHDALKSKVSSLDNQVEKISGQLKAEESKCRELENSLKVKESEWKIDKAALEEKAKVVSSLVRLIGPIPWGHSGPLCHALSLSLSSSLWTSHAAGAIAIAGV